MRIIIGIDLAVAGEHKAIVAGADGEALSGVLKLHTRASELDDLLARARAIDPQAEILVVMEPTGMAWFPVAVYLARQGVRVYVVNAQQVADLRRFYKRHAKSDRIDARVLIKLPVVNPEALHELRPGSAAQLACQRSCKELDRLTSQITAIKNRLQAVDRFTWPGLETLVYGDPFSPAARWFRQHFYDPLQVVTAGTETIRQMWVESETDPADVGAWAEELVQLAARVLALYGTAGDHLDFALLQAEVCREQESLAALEERAHTLRLKTMRPLYRQIHASRNLETIKGIGQDSAAVFTSFTGEVQRFASARQYRGWSGMVPNSKQSADSEATGLHITQAGPDLIKKFAYLDGNVARRYDPQIAAIYYKQMVKYGKHHNQAVCTCATHLLDRVRRVLHDDRPYSG